MFKRLREYLRNNKIKNKLRKVTRQIYSTDIEFDELISTFVKGYNSSKLLTLCILEIASLRVPSSENERILEVLRINADKLEDVLSSDFESVIEIQKLNAKMMFLKIKSEFLVAEMDVKINGYSFKSMRYKMEKAKKSPLTQPEWKKIYEQSEEINKINSEIETLKNN